MPVVYSTFWTQKKEMPFWTWIHNRFMLWKELLWILMMDILALLSLPPGVFILMCVRCAVNTDLPSARQTLQPSISEGRANCGSGIPRRLPKITISFSISWNRTNLFAVKFIFYLNILHVYQTIFIQWITGALYLCLYQLLWLSGIMDSVLCE